MFTDSPFEIEASDIDTLVRAGDAMTLPDGRVALPVLLVLSSASGKTFAADEFPTAMHLTNGVQVRRLVFEHLGAVVIEAHAAPAAESVNTGTEATVEINPAPATTSAATAPAAPEPAAEPAATTPEATQEATAEQPPEPTAEPLAEPAEAASAASAPEPAAAASSAAEA